MYLIDTSACIDFLRGNQNTIAHFSKAGFENCFVSEIALSELYYGAANSTNAQKHFTQVDGLKNTISILPLSNIAKEFGIEKKRLQSLGTPVQDNFDLLIGVTAVQNGFTLITSNIKDFKNIQGIKIENWRE